MADPEVHRGRLRRRDRRLPGARSPAPDGFAQQSTIQLAGAASVVLGAIAKSGERGGVIEAVLATRVANGITGSFRILPSGDPSVGPITISVARDSFVPVREVKPGQALVKAARQG
jgi:hypothetical protein